MKQIRIIDLLTDRISGEWGNEPINNKGVNIIRTANFTNKGEINFDNIVLRDIPENKVAMKKLLTGDIIIEKSGGSPTQPVGRVVHFFNPNGQIYLCNNFTTILRPDRIKVFPKYFFYALWYNHKIGRTLRYQNKTTGIINLKLDKYLNSKIPIPENYDDQIRITKILSCAETIITKRKESIRLLDKLLKSVFLKMFGDPVKNEKGWDKKSLGSLANIKIGPFGTLLHARDYIMNGYPLINPSHIVAGKIIPDINLTVSGDKYKELSNYHLEVGDIVLGRRGEIGRCAVVSGNSSGLLCGTGSMFIRVQDDCIPVFLQYQIANTSLKSILESKAKGITMKNLNSGDVEKLMVITPPIPFQEKFAKIVEIVESVRSKYELLLREYKKLYTALSQRAFRGELDLSRIPVDNDIKPEPAKQKSEGHVPRLSTIKQFTGNEIMGIAGTKSGRQLNSIETWGGLEQVSFEVPPKHDEVQDISFDMLDVGNIDFK